MSSLFWKIIQKDEKSLLSTALFDIMRLRMDTNLLRPRGRPRRYPVSVESEFLEKARSSPGQTIRSIADELGITYNIACAWIRKAALKENAGGHDEPSEHQNT